jgi:hypothetical protein
MYTDWDEAQVVDLAWSSSVGRHSRWHREHQISWVSGPLYFQKCGLNQHIQNMNRLENKSFISPPLENS